MVSGLVSLRQAAKHLGLHPRTLGRLVEEGHIPAHRFGDRYRVDVDEVLKATKTGNGQAGERAPIPA